MLIARSWLTLTAVIAIAALCAACGRGLVVKGDESHPPALSFGPERPIGQIDKNPSTPFLRFRPDGRLFALWTEDDARPAVHAKPTGAHEHAKMKMRSAPMRSLLLAGSADGGQTWSRPKRVNSTAEGIEGEEGGPRLAFGPDNRAYVVWSIPNERGDKTRANTRFAMEDGKGGFTPSRTLTEIKNTARFPIIEFAPDHSLLLAWIDRRIDNPIPRSLYLMRLNADGEKIAAGYKIGGGLCECCRLGIAFADGGKTVYMADRQVSEEQIRNHAVRKSTDGGKTFGTPIEISDDGWQVSACPHSGPSIARDGRGFLHVTWFTLGRSESEAGVYYSVSKDGGNSFAPRRLVHANTAPEILHATLAAAPDGDVYFAWDNLDPSNNSQIYVRSLARDGKTWGPIQQISHAQANASRPVIALLKNRLHVAWTETDGERTRAVIRSAAVEP